MKCSHCGEPLASIVCPECGGETMEGSAYCCRCGRPIKMEKAEIDVSERVPCRDGNCVGTINEKGVCSICGSPLAGDAG